MGFALKETRASVKVLFLEKEIASLSKVPAVSMKDICFRERKTVTKG